MLVDEHYELESYPWPTTVNQREGNIPKAVEHNELDRFEVRFNETDTANPKNWSRRKRWYITVVVAVLVLNATFASAAPSGILEALMQDLHMSQEVGTLTISLFVAGYCVGPILWGPLSEQYGRRPIFIITFLAYTGFQVGCALAKNSASLLVFRFLGGTFAAAPLTNSGAVIGDIWDASTRGKALALFTLAPFAGPALGPTISGYLSVANVSWRWVFWILSIFAGLCWIVIILTLPETYVPTILAHKAVRLRKETGDARFFAPIETQDVTFLNRIGNIVLRPFRILVQEPMLIAITAYMSFLYGSLYLLFEAYPFVFTQGHHFNAGVSGLMFLPIPAGGVIAVVVYLVYYNPRYEHAIKKHAPDPVPPEFRLEMGLVAAPMFAASFFWFAWTSYPSISFVAPMMAGVIMGWAICWIFLALFNYVIDAYLAVAASALAASTVVRSLAGAAFPLFATQMFESLNPRWAGTLLGCVALLMMPLPFVLMKFGPRLRLHSKYAPSKRLPTEPATLPIQVFDKERPTGSNKPWLASTFDESLQTIDIIQDQQ